MLRSVLGPVGIACDAGGESVLFGLHGKAREAPLVGALFRVALERASQASGMNVAVHTVLGGSSDEPRLVSLFDVSDHVIVAAVSMGSSSWDLDRGARDGTLLKLILENLPAIIDAILLILEFLK